MYGWIYVAPIVLLLVTWVKVVRGSYFDETGKVAWIPLLVATLSEAYLWLSVPFHEIMGPSYSRLRYDLIFLNLAAVLVVAIIICFWKSIARWWLFAAALSLALQWLFVGAINSVV
ncbi:MAG: hypothetical protein WB949_03910 [Candidatus Acidiferrales bacterium]